MRTRNAKSSGKPFRMPRAHSKHAQDARRHASAYKLTIEQGERGGFIGSSVEMPNVFVRGATEEECVRNTRRALEVAVAVSLAEGLRVPPPATAGLRDQQVNVRLTADEKHRLEAFAQQGGFRSVSDFIRNAALQFLGSLGARKPR